MQHVEVPVPKPKKKELLLKLEAASINPVDWKMQKGMLRPLLPACLADCPISQVGNGNNDPIIPSVSSSTFSTLMLPLGIQGLKGENTKL